MKAYQLLARLRHMTLTQGNWDEEMFSGDLKMWMNVGDEERDYEAKRHLCQ